MSVIHSSFRIKAYLRLGFTKTGGQFTYAEICISIFKCARGIFPDTNIVRYIAQPVIIVSTKPSYRAYRSRTVRVFNNSIIKGFNIVSPDPLQI